LKRTFINSNSLSHKEKEMVSFRKSFLLLGLLVAVAAVASAQQTAFSCQFNGGAPPLARSEGLAEQMGDVVLRCSGGTPTPINQLIPQVNIQIFLNVNITSKVVADPWTEAMLLIDEPAPAIQLACGDANTGLNLITNTCPILSRNGNGTGNYDSSATNVPIPDTTPTRRPNIWQARCIPGGCASSGPSTLAFLGVPVDPPGTGPDRILRIVNLRGNATQVPVSSSLLPSQILAVLSVSGPGALPIPNNTGQVVALVQKGLAFSTGSVPPNNSTDLKQCVPQNTPSGAAAPGTGRGCYQVRLRFAEQFANAFRLQGGYGQNVPGTIYNNESMFTNQNLTGRGGLGVAGIATQPTQLWARMSGIPTGVRLFASLIPIRATNVSTTGSPQSTLANVAQAYYPDPNTGSWTNVFISDISGTTRSACSTSGDGSAYNEGLNNSPYYEVTVSASGTAQIAYSVNVLGADPNQIGSFDVGLMIVYSGNPLPAQGTAQVSGNFAPISTADRMNDGSFLRFPRFIDNPSSSTLFTISTCKTNLLFTYLTQIEGFDSGIAIANTSLDPFKTTPQKGNCTLNYYGTFKGDPTKTTYSQTTTSMLDGGQTLVATLSGGGTNGIGAVAGFQGYMIATCDFQYAHGFAFISDFGATKLAQGYLANVMDYAGTIRTNTTSEVLGN
jgi:hypothetical protein